MINFLGEKHCLYRSLYRIIVFFLIFFIVGCKDKQPYLTHSAENNPKTFEQMLAGGDVPEKKQKILEGMQALREREYQAASSIFNELLTHDPTNSGLHSLNALTYQLMAKDGDFKAYDLAEAGYQQAKKFNPENTFAALQLGRVKAEKKDYIGAQEEFADVLLFDPSNQEAFYELASVSYLTGDIRTAQMCIDMVLKKDAKKPEYVRAAALIYAVQGDKKKAQALLSTYKTLEYQPKRKEYLEKRVNEWLGLHDSGNVSLVKTAMPSPPPAVIAESLSSSEDRPALDTSADDPLKPIQPPAHPLTDREKRSLIQTHNPEGMIVVDAVVLRILEEGQTTKGNNILDNFTLTIAPFTKYFAHNAGTAITGANIFPFNNASTSPSTSTGTGGAVPTVIPGVVSSALPNSNKNVSLIAGGISFGSLNYALNIANVSRTHIEIIGRPTLTSHIGKPAEFFSGEELYVALQGSFGGGSITKTPTGSTLRVTPLTIEGDYVTLNVEVIDSFLEQTEEAIAARVATLTPLVFSVNNSHASSTLKMKLGETMMLAGFIERTDVHADSGFPLLKDLPIVQYFFSRDITSSIRVSVMYLITPRIHNDVRKTATAFLEKGGLNARPNLTELESRHKNWWTPRENIIPILRSFGDLYRDYRTGDFMALRWGERPNLEEEFRILSQFLWFGP